MICILFIAYHNYHKSVVNEAINSKKDAISATSSPPSRQYQGQEGPQEPPPSQDKKDELAEMRAQQSSFGAPVVFEDMPQIQPSVAANLEADDTGTSDQEQSEEAESDFKNKESQVEKIAHQPLPKPKATDVSPDSPPTTLGQEVAQQLKAHDILQHTIAALENKEPVKETQKKLQTKKPKNQRRTSPKGAALSTKNIGNAKRSAGPTDKKFSFADLANGFLENLNRDGQDAINQRGNPNIRPGIEQLKQSSYKQKMAWNLQAAFKRAARRTKFYTPHPEQNRLECIFHITKDGELEKLEMVSSTGHQELDSYILKTIKDAFPLPPIPDHWAQDMLVQSWVFRNIQPNESSYVVNF